MLKSVYVQTMGRSSCSRHTIGPWHRKLPSRRAFAATWAHTSVRTTRWSNRIRRTRRCGGGEVLWKGKVLCGRRFGSCVSENVCAQMRVFLPVLAERGRSISSSNPCANPNGVPFYTTANSSSKASTRPTYAFVHEASRHTSGHSHNVRLQPAVQHLEACKPSYGDVMANAHLTPFLPAGIV